RSRLPRSLLNAHCTFTASRFTDEVKFALKVQHNRDALSASAANHLTVNIPFARSRLPRSLLNAHCTFTPSRVTDEVKLVLKVQHNRDALSATMTWMTWMT
ncbi:MAG: hypothetical protein ACK4NN_16295, partial [Rheinheimera sp.]